MRRLLLLIAVVVAAVASPAIAQRPQSLTKADSGIPKPADFSGFPVRGQIVAISGQVIEGVHVTTTTGPCIEINGASHVTVRNSEIGPCGQPGEDPAKGVNIHNGASNITISRNWIHDVSTGVYAEGARHPIVMDRNLVTNVRGPMPRGQMIQLNNVTGGSGATKITCNVSDQRGLDLPAGWAVEDHINLYRSSGVSTTEPIEVAYNRLRGGRSNTGSAIMTGDGGGGNVWAHDNVAVNVSGAGIGVASGTNVKVENNRIYMGVTTSKANIGGYVWNQGSNCSNVIYRNNRIWTSNNNPFWNGGGCANVTISGNLLQDTGLTALMFDEVPAQCN